ncbi:MAG: hypothetical protein EOO09_17380 [Chitinophagaceae bacterium]|nr:MAG: hypothetical protein EOO09_17380 [Chitinophagaceae bacterium]
MKLILVLAVSTWLIACNNDQTVAADVNKGTATDSSRQLSAESQPWKWSDSLDAVAAAPANHKIVYEDSAVRVLMVVCPPGKEEAVHTHRYKSTMWFTNSAHLVFYNYAADANNRLVKKDSAEINGFPAEMLNKGQQVDPEEPHSIRNAGSDTFIAYRVEYKKEFKD